MRVLIGLLISAAALLASCDKPVVPSNKFVGTWQFYQSCGGVVGCPEPAVPQDGSMKITESHIEIIRMGLTVFSADYDSISVTGSGEYVVLLSDNTTMDISLSSDGLLSIHHHYQLSDQYRRIGYFRW